MTKATTKVEDFDIKKIKAEHKAKKQEAKKEELVGFWLQAGNVIMRIVRVLVAASIAYSATVIVIGTDYAVGSIIMVSPMVIYAAYLLIKK